MRVCVFKGVVHLSVCMWGVSSEMNYRDHITSHQLQPPSSSSLCPFSLLQSNSFTLLPKHHESGCGMYVSAAKRFHCIFRHFLKNKGCFVGARFQCLHQLFQSDSHLSQLMVPPVPSHRKWGIRITRGGYEKGHLFHCCRWQSSRRNNRAERKRAHEEMRDEMKKKLGAIVREIEVTKFKCIQLWLINSTG